MSDLSFHREHISIVSNITTEQYLTANLKIGYCKNVEFFFIPYNEHFEANYQKQLRSSSLILVWLNFEFLFPDIYFADFANIQEIIERNSILCEKLYFDLSAIANARILWFTYDDYQQLQIFCGNIYNTYIDQLNMSLCKMLTNRVTFIDLKRLIANIGISYAYDFKARYRWDAPYTKALLKEVAHEIGKQYLIEKGVTKKCLIMDCDNVLWGGILSEDGVENIKLSNNGLGRAYQNFQYFVLSLYYHGVILAICSKNDPSDVINMFKIHDAMILKMEHIAFFQVNWDNKPANIKKISEMLNIGLDSIVFVDDSIVEIEAVKTTLPEVTTILFNQYMSYKQFDCFNLKSDINIENIRYRNDTYRSNQSREHLKSLYENYNDFLKALDIKIDIHKAQPTEYARISELTQRTNKCTNGKRYTVEKIKNLCAANDNILYALNVSDRFSDYGLVGAIEIAKNRLVMFSLSCRALGRNIEEYMISYIISMHNIEELEIYDTDKNHDFKAMLLKAFPNAKLILLHITGPPN